VSGWDLQRAASFRAKAIMDRGDPVGDDEMGRGGAR